jgi:hypothetical protein
LHEVRERGVGEVNPVHGDFAAGDARVIDEVVAAYAFNTELFVDLSRAKAAA